MSRIEMVYGDGSKLDLEFRPDARIERLDAPRGVGVSDLSAAVAQALAEPLSHPPLVQATFPGDKVVVALGDGVPQSAAIVDAVARTLLAGGASPSDIIVLTTLAEGRRFESLAHGQAGPHHKVKDSRGNRTAVMTKSTAVRRISCDEHELAHLLHDPADRRNLALLARTSDQMPVLLNRALLDADVVVSIGCLQAKDALGYDGLGESLCPTFSDEATQRRFRALHTSETPGRHAARAQTKSQEVAWLLGGRFTVQVVPGRGQEIQDVVAGDIEAVAAEGKARYEAAWRYDAPRPASLVIAAIEGGLEQQSWDKISRALSTGVSLVEPGGAIALCTDLDDPPGAALQQLAGAKTPEEAARSLRNSHLADGLAALQLAHALEELHVYLLSRLDRATVEDLGLVPMADAEELGRLVRAHSSCLLLSNAQHIRLTPRQA
jgi:nickel-dependent lactate racemase